MSGASLYGVDLSSADLRGAILIDTDLIGARVERTRFGQTADFSRDLRRDLRQRGAILEE
ncbi:pentapeptide repeat-containing protein [Phormidesmis priestleyi]|uniref:pentapeptide repeat-containing protein n=1 Tax=Phormidesmis priestleyi TaxID=268141 RepID=UPI0012E7F780|nr:pentapeptide repeat-containing protein [Phormidesmis priestleyi]